MQEHVTLLPPEPPSSKDAGISSSLPPDLLEQVRGRVKALAAFMFVGFAFDPTLFLTALAAAGLASRPLPDDVREYIPFLLADLLIVALSAGVWWLARQRSVSTSRLLTVVLAYEVVICLEIGITMPWQYYVQKGFIPPLTWAPTIIVLFPLIMPGPPRRMVPAAIIAGAMSPLGLMVLDLLHLVPIRGEDYGPAIFSSVVVVVFASLGARVVYRLGREVSAARELGSYRLLERLGLGGMGEVWRARHRMLARSAAIKLIRPSNHRDGRRGPSAEMARRFEREAQAIARLRSPHTVELFDFGMAENGAFYYVMELLDGLDADKLVRRFGPLPPERVVFILGQVCHSLSEANSCGLIHRDIKPANIFLCRYGEDCDFVKVLDFGLVKAFDDPILDEPEPGAAALTRENTVHGTPAFIAPEQALGQADIDGRADIYAVGCVGYWLLTGRLVFTADTPMGLLMHHIHTLPEPPSRVPGLSIPSALEEVILACLAKEPSQRPQSAGELSSRLADIDGLKGWTAAKARSWWDEHLPAESHLSSSS
jgi:eukaryotic-like serine/threonine-protein kinase